MALALGTQTTETTQIIDGRTSSGLDAPDGASSADSTWLFPGLGCRFVGMGHDIIGQFPIADRLIAESAARLGFDLVAVCLEGSGRKHVPPRQEAQVIYVLECAYAAVLQNLGFRPQMVSGHSLGTWAAGYACGGYDFLTGLNLVTHVEELMEEHIDGRGQAMGVIIGLPEKDVEALLEAAAGVHLANWNSRGQYVVGGAVGGVDFVLSGALAQGAKQARRLAGGRALHTPHLSEVAARVRKHLDQTELFRPRVPFVRCTDGRMLQTAEELRTSLGDFLALPVHWETTVQALRQRGAGAFVEVGPGNVLSNMLPYIDRTASIRTASDLLDQKR